MPVLFEFVGGVDPLQDGETQLQRWSSLIGIVTAIIGNIFVSFALNIQRYAHIRLHDEKVRKKERTKSAAKDAQSGYGTVRADGRPAGNSQNDNTDNAGGEEPLRNSFHSSDTDRSDDSTCSKHDTYQVQTYLKSPYWWGGIVLMTVGEAGNFLAYGFAPASIVSPLGVVALISNCVIAPVLLKERFRFRDFCGVVVAVAGAVVVVLSAKTEEKKIGPHEVWGAITNFEFEIYMSITIFLIAVLMWASPKYGNKTILIDLGVAGLFGAYTALSTKGVASMLSSTLWRAFTTPVTYALIVILVGTAVMQVRYVNKALQRFNSTQVIPVQFVLFTLSVIIGSAILYRDFEKATGDSIGKFVGGCLLTFLGVYLITSNRQSNDDENDEDEESDVEGEERITLVNHDPTESESPLQKRDSRSAQESSSLVQNGDGNDDKPTGSRRSSHISFAESSRPRTPRMYSNSSKTPVSNASSEPKDGNETPWLKNPWKTSNEDIPEHPGLFSASSQPVLPTEAQTSLKDHLKPPPLGRPTSQGNLHTHPNLQHLPAPPQADRPATPVARHSIARMMPGPFISPLSGGLSVVVADTLMRGVESTRVKRPKLGIRRSKSGSQRLSHGPTRSSYYDETGSSPAKQTDSDNISKSLETEEGNRSRVTRSRSLSNTLGDLFRGKRQRLESRDGQGDEEAGPSGS